MTRPHCRAATDLAMLLGLAVLAVACGRSPMAAMPPAPEPEYAPGLQRLLEARIALLQDLACDPIIQVAVAEGNRNHAPLTPAEIAERDRRWQQAGADDAAADLLLRTPAARRLAAFCAVHPGFSEVFVTDRHGLVVAMSNRTSDYLQADEVWWQQAYAGGQGRLASGGIEYDASSHSQAIALYVPVPGAPGGPVAGVIKALYGVVAIKAEL